MVLAKKDEATIEDFTVVDENKDLVTGLVDGDFTKELYNPNGTEVSTVINVSVDELGGGSYRADFTPNQNGVWYLIVFHPVYFPWGKADTILVYERDLSDIGLDSELARKLEAGRWHKTHNQWIVYEEDNVTEVMRFDLFDDAGNPTMINIFERRRV